MDKEQVSAAPADREAWMQEATMTDLHAQIMNIPCKPYDGTDAYTHYCRGHRDARHAAAELASEALRAAAPAVQQDGWMPIESAPKNRKVLVAYRNSLGKWRRVMACHYTESEIAEWENDDSTPGWYEECESQEVILPVEGTPELWHELPPIDAAADHIADAGEMVAAAVPALPVAWMKRRAVSAEWDAYDFSANRSDEFCIPLYAAPVAACACGPDCQDEGPPTCRYTHAAPVAAPAARATWFDPSTGMTLRQRCSVALECLPEAPYRQQLARLLDDLMVAPAAEAQLRQLPGEPEEEYLGRRAEAQTLEPTWVLLLRHGMSPVRKGPFFADAPIEQMVRDLYALHADATVIVINMPVTAYPMSGREWVAMHGDRRCKAIPGAPSPQRPMVMPSHSEPGFVKPDTDQHVFFYEQDFYVLSNFSAFNLRWQGRTFPTSEHAYHWMKFPTLTRDEEGRYVRDHIFRAPSAHEAFKLAERWKSLRRPDWDAAKVDIMRDILRAKAAQHEYVRRKLLATGDRELIEDSWRDNFWGWGPNRDGQNMLGKLWMEVRAELRAAKNGAAVAPKEN
jgi:ribA/ribD-fused uncharacterized protein